MSSVIRGSDNFDTAAPGSKVNPNGYLKLSNGLIMQWGTAANPGASTLTTVTFPLAFPTACLSFTASLNSGAGATAPCMISSFSTTTAIYDSAVNSTTKNPTIWFAFGY